MGPVLGHDDPHKPFNPRDDRITELEFYFQPDESIGWDIIVVKSRMEVFSPSGMSAGASGAICGLIFLGYVYARAESHRLGTIARSLQTWIIYLAGFTFLFPGIDVPAHVCGALAGAGAGALIQPKPGKDPHRAWKPVAIALAFLCLACFGGMVWAMRTGRGLV